MHPPPAKDLPLRECVDMANDLLTKNATTTIYQKWTCPHCGQRVTMNDENIFYATGFHEECGKTSPIIECGFLAILGGPGE